MLQCVAVCCRVLQSVVGCCSVLQLDTYGYFNLSVCCSVLQFCYSVMQWFTAYQQVNMKYAVTYECLPTCIRSALCCSVLQCIAAFCSVLWCVTMCCSMLQLYCSVLQMYCSVLQCVAVCCSVLQCVAILLQCDAVVYCLPTGEYVVLSNIWMCARLHPKRLELQCVAAFRSVLQCVAVCCSVLQCVAVLCSTLQFVALLCSCTAVALQLHCSVLQCVAVCCNSATVWCSGLLLACGMK